VANDRTDEEDMPIFLQNKPHNAEHVKIPMPAWHQAMPLLRSLIEEFQGQDREAFSNTSAQKCRDPDPEKSIRPSTHYMRKSIWRGVTRVHLADVPDVALLRDSKKIGRAEWYKAVLKTRPARFCINDDWPKTMSEAEFQQEKAKLMRDFFDKYFSADSDSDAFLEESSAHSVRTIVPFRDLVTDVCPEEGGNTVQKLEDAWEASSQTASRYVPLASHGSTEASGRVDAVRSISKQDVQVGQTLASWQ